MGQRANLIVVTQDGVELYYSHWAANTLDRDLFWGPGHATAFARRQRSEAEGAEWLDEVWSEGGAVIDHTRRQVLWYGGEDILYDVPLRRLHLALMQKCWRGWEVSWASEGIVALARHIGIPKERVLVDRKPRSNAPNLAPPEQRDWTDTVITVVDSGEARAIPLASNARGLVESGVTFLAELRRAPGLPRLDYAEWSTVFPQGGIHVDFDRQVAGFWFARPSEDVLVRAAPTFGGLSVEYWGDDYDRHLALARSFLTFPPVDPTRQFEELSATLLGDDVDRSEAMLNAIKALADGGRTVSGVNPLALRDDVLEVPHEKRAEMLAHAFADWQSGSGSKT